MKEEQMELYRKLNDKNSLREVQRYVNQIN